MDVRRIRKEKLARLVHELDGQAELGRRIDTPPAYISQLLNDSTRNIGHRFARKIESHMGYPEGWMDREDSPNVAVGPVMRGEVPLISWVNAGAWGIAEDPYYPGDGEAMLACPVSHGPRTYALRVEGDSMTAPGGASYPPGTIIYVDPDQAGGVGIGNLCIAKVDNHVTFKLYQEDAGRPWLRPLNPQYQPIPGPFEIVGKVIGAFVPAP